MLGLMYLMYPVAYPTAVLLDYILGEDHGTVYKKAGLKTLVTLHKSLGPSPSDRLNQDEVTIISAVLDLKDKPVGSIMTPMKNVFTMSSDTVLDEEAMDRILSAGYSRIPIHAPGEPFNFVGMLLVKILITYDPEDGKRVGEFPLATLPETREETSCLDIVNFFQEGKSHMVLVSEAPGENHGALGVVTLEDVIEELIGEWVSLRYRFSSLNAVLTKACDREIIDESDVFIDVHKAIRRINPSPLSRRSISTHFPRLGEVTMSATGTAITSPEIRPVADHDANNDKKWSEDLLLNPEGNISRTNAPNSEDVHPPPTQRSSLTGIPETALPQLKFLGPANLAGNPKQTKSKTVKIKPAGLHDELVRIASSAGEGLGQAMQHIGCELPPALPMRSENTTPQLDGGAEPPRNGKRIARSGSLIERVEHVAGGVPKTVIETTSGSEEDDDNDSPGSTSKKNGNIETRPLLG